MFQTARSFFHLLIIAVPPDLPWWSIFLIWFARLVTAAILLRTYIAPWILAKTSRHVRVRSISLRSIRGVYLNYDDKVWKIDRIAYRWAQSRFTVVLEGVSIEMKRKQGAKEKKKNDESHQQPVVRMKRPATVSAPFEPLAKLVTVAFNTLWAALEPIIRPLLRYFAFSTLRNIVSFLPRVTDAAFLDITDITLTFSDIPGLTLTCGSAIAHASVQFSHETLRPSRRSTVAHRRQSLANLGTLRRRLNDGFRRTWRRVSEDLRGQASLSLAFQQVDAKASPGALPFFFLPEAIRLEASLNFIGYHTVDDRSVELGLHIGKCNVNIEQLLEIWKKFERIRSKSDAPATRSRRALTISLPSPGFRQPKSSETLKPSPQDDTASSPSSTLSPKSPYSPFLESLSASVLRTKFKTQHSVKKLTDGGTVSPLWWLKQARITVSSLTVVFRLPNHPSSLDPFNAIFQDVSFLTAVSNPLSHSVHKQTLGGHKFDAVLDRDCFVTSVSAYETGLARNGVRLITLGQVHLSAFLSQWPYPWLDVPAFMNGDPNSALVRVKGSLETLEFRWDQSEVQLISSVLAARAARKAASPSPIKLFEPEPSPTSFELPRFSVDLSCGEVYGLCSVNEALGFQVLTDGFEFSCRSQYIASQVGAKPTSTSAAEDPFRLEIDLSCLAHPLKVVGAPADRARSCSRTNHLTGSVLLALGSNEFHGHGVAEAHLADPIRNIAAVDKASIFFDLSAVSSGLSVHLDDPLAMTALLWLLTSNKPTTTRAAPEPPLPPPPTLISKLPKGLSLNVTCERFSVLLMSPDINPDSKEGTFIGLDISTGFSLQYASIRPENIQYFTRLSERAEARHKLYLEEERLVEALAGAKRARQTGLATASVRANLFHLRVRPAVRTPGQPIVEPLKSIVAARRVRCDLALSALPSSSTEEKCAATVRVPDVEIGFSTWHVYSALLALRALRHPSLSTSASKPKPRRLMHLTVDAKLEKMEIDVKLRKERCVLLLDNIHVNLHPVNPVQARIGSINGLVPVVARSRWQLEPGEPQWHSLIFGRDWRVEMPPSEQIKVQGEAARLRIPSGYILADLIQDVSVVAKASRRLTVSALSGIFRPFENPEAEGPKSVPNVHVMFASLCVEIADDPFESQLGLIWRASLDGARHRVERDAAFEAKAAVVTAFETGADSSSRPTNVQYHFGSEHTISITEAHQRLYHLHYLDHIQRLNAFRKMREADAMSTEREIQGQKPPRKPSLDCASADLHPPLLRVMLRGLDIHISPPSFPIDQLPDFLHKQGGMPLDSQYSLLVPLHLRLKFASLRVTIRDYPYPLLDVPPNQQDPYSCHFDTDLVIAEQMGPEASVDWVSVPIVDEAIGCSPLSLAVPKTIMPVKSFAAPSIDFTTDSIVRISWGISYSSATQDITRIVDTITSAPRDSSPSIGFWDKMRLVFHWKLKVHFKGGVQYHMKSSRNPHDMRLTGRGFALLWLGNPKLLIAQENGDDELIQVISDKMLVVIPSSNSRQSSNARPYTKVCAKFSSGIRFGVGVVLERACGEECQTCYGSPFHRRCRFFHFKPHYAVTMQKKIGQPVDKSPEDSFNEFRSDFIHMSISLTSSVRNFKPGSTPQPSSLHLTPKVFKHFWSWWSLFEGVLSLPIRTGSYWPSRKMQPKFGRHVSTLKYRISVPNLFVMHAYIDDSRETWSDSVTPWVGVKAWVSLLQVDMHQRDQEYTVPGQTPGSKKVIHRKPFYAAELVMQQLDLRVLVASFPEKVKSSVSVNPPAAPFGKGYRSRSGLPKLSVPSSRWYDADDFVEIDWTPVADPVMHLLPIASCPRFTYFKKNLATMPVEGEKSKFGKEDTHHCLLGQEPGVEQIQLDLLRSRVEELRTSLPSAREADKEGILQMIASLEEHINQAVETHLTSPELNRRSSFIASGNEWARFDHVYQVHFPRLFVDPAIRDILIQYYHCSRAVRGFEYHVATRAVKYILDQAAAQASAPSPVDDANPGDSHTDKGHFATAAFRKLLNPDGRKQSIDIGPSECPKSILVDDPLKGWSDGVSRERVHCCYLLKPQLILRADPSIKDCCTIAASQARLQADAYIDNLNEDDPINRKIMSRIQIKLSDLQLFAPLDSISITEAGVPPEVLVDERFEPMGFVRLVPQTNAEFVYDKFNRLRIRNNNILVSPQTDHDQSISNVTHTNHLRDETDLVQINIPRFTVTADDRHFRTISDLVTKLVLFSDANHKVETDRLETMLFTYDFTDIPSVVQVVADFQSKLRIALETARLAEGNPLMDTEAGRKEFTGLRAHIQTLSEELNFLFDAIKLAQDKSTNKSEMTSALLMKTWSSELSWRMLDERKELLAKLVCKDTQFSWLSRTDSSTVSELTLGNLQAFDGSPEATWTEILCKQEEHSTHPMAKRNLFAKANWVILPPVGGITIYEHFSVDLHPLRLQADAKVGVRIMEYLLPSRKARRHNSSGTRTSRGTNTPQSRSSMDSPRGLPAEENRTLQVPPPLRKLSASRSFTDLRPTSLGDGSLALNRTHSSDRLHDTSEQRIKWKLEAPFRSGPAKRTGDASEMKTRSSQKSFVLVQISSLDLVLSIQKDDSFVCRDAHIKTRALEYRNQTWSFEELVNQFIPADMSWKGWLRMAFHQPLIPVFPVARELIAKTKFLSASKSRPASPSPMVLAPSKPNLTIPQSHTPEEEDDPISRPGKGWRRTSRRSSVMVRPQTPQDETAPNGAQDLQRSGSGKRRLAFWKSPPSRASSTSNSSNSSTPVPRATSSPSQRQSSKPSSNSQGSPM